MDLPKNGSANQRLCRFRRRHRPEQGAVIAPEYVPQTTTERRDEGPQQPNG